jgi:Ni/Co efflux regulator RcnB
MTAGAANADKPDFAGHGKHKKEKEKDKEKGKEQGKDKEHSHDHGHDHDHEGHGFTTEDRRIVSEYYSNRASKGKCPPGLAKKNNGCQAPGQAKKWARGQVLSSNVKTFDVPKELRVRLSPPPPNHRYVQIENDILLIAIGTSLVVWALEDILR